MQTATLLTSTVVAAVVAGFISFATQRYRGTDRATTRGRGLHSRSGRARPAAPQGRDGRNADRGRGLARSSERRLAGQTDHLFGDNLRGAAGKLLAENGGEGTHVLEFEQFVDEFPDLEAVSGLAELADIVERCGPRGYVSSAMPTFATISFEPRVRTWVSRAVRSTFPSFCAVCVTTTSRRTSTRTSRRST